MFLEKKSWVYVIFVSRKEKTAVIDFLAGFFPHWDNRNKRGGSLASPLFVSLCWVHFTYLSPVVLPVANVVNPYGNEVLHFMPNSSMICFTTHCYLYYNTIE